jgi:hypothetical protein
MLRESQPFGSQPVDVRSLKFSLALTAYIAVTQIVGQYEDNVWFFACFRCSIFLLIDACK